MKLCTNMFKRIGSVLFVYIVLSFYCYNCVRGQSITLDYGKYQVTYLDLPGKKVHCCNEIPKGRGFPLLQIFCYHGTPQELVYIFQTASMELSLTVDDYERYDGSTPQDVILEYEADRSSWSIQMFAWKDKNIHLNPFNSSCVGISSRKHNYDIYLNVIRVDFWKLLLLLVGMSLYVLAPTLCGNPLFYYICGVSFGICASLLVLVYLISKLIPTRPMMYGFVIGGWTVGIYVIQMLWDNLRLIAFQYQSRVLWYVAVTGMISFVVCYRMGPVTDPRSKNLIKWTLQIFAIFMMYLSSEFREAALTLILIFLSYQHFPPHVRAWVVSSWKKQFPPKVRNLSNEEYYQQGMEATNKGIEDLRQYCSSPECDAWRTMRKLQDPKRFAIFMAGASHIDDDEVLNYEVSDTLLEEITDDESD